jgi:hypothetical protein
MYASIDRRCGGGVVVWEGVWCSVLECHRYLICLEAVWAHATPPIVPVLTRDGVSVSPCVHVDSRGAGDSRINLSRSKFRTAHAASSSPASRSHLRRTTGRPDTRRGETQWPPRSRVADLSPSARRRAARTTCLRTSGPSNAGPRCRAVRAPARAQARALDHITPACASAFYRLPNAEPKPHVRVS